MNRVDDPRPAHQCINPAEQLSSGLDGPTRCVVVRQIGLHEAHSGRRLGSRPVDPDHLGAQFPQYSRELMTQAAGRTCDDHPAVRSGDR
ncbi:hypothetical protein ADL25_43000 [Streptomyces sp. NRRL F-5122]|nr:hypothetical protein ADL25_43000 [Streptomyces sp. NRRL F-5122]